MLQEEQKMLQEEHKEQQEGKNASQQLQEEAASLIKFEKEFPEL